MSTQQVSGISKQRFVTLDVFRGLTVFLMIIVNTPGSGATPFSQLLHADWNGCTLTDLVFPSFLFAAGNALYFSTNNLRAPGLTPLAKIFRRSALIFLTGFLLSWYCSLHWTISGRLGFTPLSDVRIMAVLQRIALCYLIAAVAIRYCKPRYLLHLCIGLLFLYWALLWVFGDAGQQYSILGNAVRKLDVKIFGAQHLYKEHGIIFDPEGLLSTLPAIVNVIAGYMVGAFLARQPKKTDTATKLICAGILFVGAGLVWDVVFPFNKKLWTSSYVVFSVGIDIIVLGILYFLIEIRSIQTGRHFFSVFGKNPLFVYALSNLFIVVFILHVSPDLILYEQVNAVFFQRILPGALGSLLFAVSFTLLCWVAGWWLDKKRIYVRL